MKTTNVPPYTTCLAFTSTIIEVIYEVLWSAWRTYCLNWGHIMQCELLQGNNIWTWPWRKANYCLEEKKERYFMQRKSISNGKCGFVTLWLREAVPGWVTFQEHEFASWLAALREHERRSKYIVHNNSCQNSLGSPVLQLLSVWGSARCPTWEEVCLPCPFPRSQCSVFSIPSHSRP